MVDDLHSSVLLDPQLSHDDVVDAAVDIGPGIRLVPPFETSQFQCFCQLRGEHEPHQEAVTLELETVNGYPVPGNISLNVSRVKMTPAAILLDSKRVIRNTKANWIEWKWMLQLMQAHYRRVLISVFQLTRRLGEMNEIWNVKRPFSIWIQCGVELQLKLDSAEC